MAAARRIAAGRPIWLGGRMAGATVLRSRRFWIAAAALAAVAVGYVFGVFEPLTLEALRGHRDELSDWVDDNVLLAALAYLGVYAAAVALSVPCAALLTLSGGFFFGAALAGPLAVLASTAGASVLFMLVRLLMGADALDRLGPAAARIAAGLRRNAGAYLLAVRFAPFVPFSLVNLVPALAGVPLRTFVVTTFFGVMPATLVFSLAGAGLGSLLETGEAVTARAVLTPEIVAALFAMAAAALASIPLRRWALAR
jgi:uncharacterized membrane protein YdjX (TVP38/TMEM64 family)